MKHPAALLAAFLLLTAALAAEGGEASVEILAGSHTSTLGPTANNLTLGVRGGYRFSDRWALEGTLSRVDLADVRVPWARFHLAADATYFDVSAKWFITPRKKHQFYLYGGPGVSFYDLEINDVNVLSVDDSFAWHVGTGVSLALNERIFLRPDLRFRWDSRIAAGDADVEFTLGIGWRFGRTG